MATQRPPIDAIRQRFAAGPLARAGWSFERAMQVPAIATALTCAAIEAERASQRHRSRPHWAQPQE